MTDIILGLKSNFRYIQPHYEWAECITSHRISRQSFIDLMDYYKPIEHRVVTTYHNNDIIYMDIYDCSSKIRSVTGQINYFQEALIFDNLELIGENIVGLPATKFAPALNYHYERQSVQLINDTMVLEILIPHIVHPNSIDTNDIIKQILKDNLSNIISLSYRFIVKNISSNELSFQIKNLKNLTKPFELTMSTEVLNDKEMDI